MAHGVLKQRGGGGDCKTGIGSRRIFAPHFKLQVLDSYRNDADCKGNQRATARKYGIHRRQIQKWLQVEGNLRNSVGSSAKTAAAFATKSGEPEARKCGIELALRSVAQHGRQRDDLCPDAYSQCRIGSGGASAEARVPVLSPVPVACIDSNTSPQPYCWTDVDATTTSNNNNNNVITNDAHLRSPSVIQGHPSGPAPLDFTTHSRGEQVSLRIPSTSPDLTPVDPTIPMDLSVKKPAMSAFTVDTKTPVFLPYQPPTPPHSLSPTNLVSSSQMSSSVWDLSTKGVKRKCEDLHSPSSSSTASSTQSNSKPVKLFKPYLDDLHDNSNSSDDCQIKNIDSTPCCSSGTVFYSNCENYHNNNNVCDWKNDYRYSLHESQLKNPLNYYCSITQTYMCQRHGCCSPPYEDNLSQNIPTLKQRQSYTLDFKLSAIECYYQDTFCRGNQRAVANKYNIHRRQVQKWLQQEDELRQRNETMKHMHAVR